MDSAPTATPGAALIPPRTRRAALGSSSKGKPQRPVWVAPGLEFGVQACLFPEGRGGNTLTACWKSVDMPMLSSTLSRGRFSFSHTSCRRDSSTCRAPGDSTVTHLHCHTSSGPGATDPHSCLSLKPPSHRTCHSYTSHGSTEERLEISQIY